MLIENIYYKAQLYSDKLDIRGKIIFNNYISIFICNQIPIKFKLFFLDENDQVQKNIDIRCRIQEFEFFVILTFFEIKEEPIISVKEYFPDFYNEIENQYINFEKLQLPKLNFSNKDIIDYINQFKNLINNYTIKELFKKNNFNSLYFIVNKQNNLLDDKDPVLYLEKVIYFLFVEHKNNIEDLYISEKEFILSLKNFYGYILSLTSLKYENILYSMLKSYLIKILAKCNYILSKACLNDYTNLNIFHSKIFLNKNNIPYNIFSKNISINFIKYRILSRFDLFNLNKKESLGFNVNNCLNLYYKSKGIIKILNDIEKDSIPFVRFFKYLKVNCHILLYFLEKIYDFKCLFNNWQNKYITFSIKEEKSKSFALIKQKIYIRILEKNILAISKSDFKNKNLYCRTPVNFSYYFNEEQNDIVETTTDFNLLFFIKNKLYYINSFVDNCINNKIKEEILLSNGENFDLIINSFYPLTTKLNYSFYSDITNFLNIKIENINIKISKKDILFDTNIINSYLEKTYKDILEPNYSNLIVCHKQELNRLYYDHIYPIIFFNYSISEYFNDFIFNDKMQVDYKNYVDFSELINSINNTNFHKNFKLNSLFHIKAINYIINSNDSLIYVFLHLLFELILKIPMIKKYLKNIMFKVKIARKTKEKNLNSKKDVNSYFKDDKLINNPFFVESSDLENKSEKNEINEEILKTEKNSNNCKMINEPIIGYCGYIPNTFNFVGKNKGIILNSFYQEYIVKNRNNYKCKFKDNIKEKISNIFDKLFTVSKVINENEYSKINKLRKIVYLIEIHQNNISELLEPYLEEEKFVSLLNYEFPRKTKINIPKSWKKILDKNQLCSHLYKYNKPLNLIKEV